MKLVAGPDWSSHAGEDHRLRDKEHQIRARQPCVRLCGRTPADPHHLRFAQPRALGRKASDEYTIPVAAVNIANCIAMATRRRGWRESTSIPFRSRSGCAADETWPGAGTNGPGRGAILRLWSRAAKRSIAILRGAPNRRD